jgi:hypothetical protein
MVTWPWGLNGPRYTHGSVSGLAEGVTRKYTEPELEFGRPEFGPVWANSHVALIQPRSSYV